MPADRQPVVGDAALAQRAWAHLNDCGRLDLALRYRAETLACAAIVLAARGLGVRLPSACDGAPWWEVVGADARDMAVVVAALLGLYRRAPAAWLAPLALQRTLRGISVIAAAGLLVLGVGLATVAGAGMMQYGLPPPTAAQLAPPSAESFAAFFGIAAFSFGTQCTILPVQDGMRQPRRAGTALAASLLVVALLYACVGVALALIGGTLCYVGYMA